MSSYRGYRYFRVPLRQRKERKLKKILFQKSVQLLKVSSLSLNLAFSKNKNIQTSSMTINYINPLSLS